MRFSTLCFLSLILSFSAKGDEWKPIDPAELAEKSPRIDKAADAEVLFWNISILDTAQGGSRYAIFTNYRRIKIYNNRGRNRWATINITIPQNSSISEIAARTIHPDGTIIDVKKDSIYDSQDKIGNSVVKKKSFAMPAVEAGSIIEYRWNETRDNGLGYLRLEHQIDIPVRIVRYSIKPHSFVVYSATNISRKATMAMQNFNCDPAPLVLNREGFYETSLQNVPAFHPEPYMPPQDEARAWSLIYYRLDDKIDPEKFWMEFGKSKYEYYKSRMKASQNVRAAAAEIAGHAGSDDEKVSLLSDFCRSTIRNLNTDAVSAEERAEIIKKVDRMPDDTLKKHIGNNQDILMLFAALVSSTGLEARVALMSSRHEIFFDPSFANAYFMKYPAIAVRIGDHWRFCDPASAFVPNNMLNSQNEGVPALITDPKAPFFEKTPISSPEQSALRNLGMFRLAEDGALEGEMVMTFTGHEGSIKKQVSERQSPSQREETFKNFIRSRINNAELSNIVIENATDPVKPFAYRCHIRVPGFADRTGKRLFIAPAVFRQGIAPLFPVKERSYPVFFPHPWMEEDTVTIELPKGFEFENPERPPSFAIGKMGRYELDIGIKEGKLVYKRKFSMGEGGQMSVALESYPALKMAFDRLQLSDKQTLTLKLSDKSGGQ